MKKVLVFLAAVTMLSSVGFAQNMAQRGNRGQQTPAAAFKSQLKKQAAKAQTKAAGDTISTFPWTEGFENGTTGFTFIDNDGDGLGWEVFTQSGDQFAPNSGDACIASASWDAETEAALTPDNWMILPALQIPTDASTFELSWYEKSQDPSYADEYYSVYIATTGRAVSNFTATAAAYSGMSTGSYIRRTVDLSSYAGQTIHVAFRHHNCTDMFYLVIDDIRVGGASAPTITIAGPASVAEGHSATYVATTDASTVAWTVNGTAQSTTDATMSYTFATPGSYEVIATVSNVVGSSSDTIEVTVYSCANNTLPYTPDFTNGLGCWDTVNFLTQGYGWFASVDMFSGEPVGQVLSMSAVSNWFSTQDVPVDNWLISPDLTMPSTGTYEIAYQVMPYSNDGDHYGVYVISGTDTTLLFQESLTGLEGFNQRVVYIPSTVSGTFQIAFRHFNSVDGYVIILDNIQVRAMSAPILTLQGPADAENGENATFTAVCPNATSYAWTVDGNASSETTNTLTTSFTTDGFHTVVVTATNSVGSASDTLTLEVYTCSTIASFPYTMDFENGVRCWTLVSMDPANDGEFGLQSQYVNGGDNGFMFSSYASADDYNQYLISPELSLPATGDYVLKLQYMGYSADESFRIMVSSTDRNPSSFTEVANYEETATEWTLAGALLPAGTKYVAINYYGNYKYYLFVDDLSIEQLSEAPEVTIAGPASAMAGDEVTFTANAPFASSFSWTVDGVDANNNTRTLTTTFNEGGNHTVSVAVANSFGTNSASATINIVACDPIAQFPFAENFEDQSTLACWRIIDADGDGYNWQYLNGTFDDGTPYGHNSNGCIASASYINNLGALNPDNYLVMPAVELPAGQNLILSWYAKGIDPNYANEYYSVYVSTTGATVNDFTTAAFSGNSTSEWVGHNVDLSQYAGQTVYIAFRHYNCTDQFYLELDDIKISAERVGIDDVNTVSANVYPNPASDMLVVEAEGVSLVQMLDVNGRVALSAQSAGRMDISGLAAGVYVVRVVCADGVSTTKIVKE